MSEITTVRHEERDPEAVALDVALHYMNRADEHGKERFMYHLQHRYFQTGFFIPKLLRPMTIGPPGWEQDHKAAKTDPGPMMPPQAQAKG